IVEAPVPPVSGGYRLPPAPVPCPASRSVRFPPAGVQAHRQKERQFWYPPAVVSVRPPPPGPSPALPAARPRPSRCPILALVATAQPPVAPWPTSHRHGLSPVARHGLPPTGAPTAVWRRPGFP